MFNEIVAYEKKLDFATALSKAQEYVNTFPEDKAAAKELTFLQSANQLGVFMQFYDFKEVEERVILVGVQTAADEDVEASLDELEELARTAGAVTVGKVIQNREAVHPGTYIGKGKIEEVAALMHAADANGVICDDELSPAQLNNLERELDCKVMDRTLLILDIFAATGSLQRR